MLQAILSVFFYCLGRAEVFLLPFISALLRKARVVRFGGVTFCGAPSFVEDCLSALRDELPRYDRELQERFRTGNVHLTFFDQTSESEEIVRKFFPGRRFPKFVSNYAAGFFGVDESTYRNGPESICQFVVFRYLQTVEIGTGLRAAIKFSDKNWRHASFARTWDQMIKWLEAVGFPERWADGYRKKKEAILEAAKSPAASPPDAQ